MAKSAPCGSHVVSKSLPSSTCGDRCGPQTAIRHLRPGGTLALSTPSASGLPARVLGRRFPMLCPPNHLELFSRAGMTALLERSGVRPFRWDSFSNLDRPALERSFQRYFLGGSSSARIAAQALAALAHAPVQLVDRAGLGISFEIYAEPVAS